MKKHITLSNILFIAVIAFVLYTPTRIWLIRQVSLSPSVEKTTKNTVKNYHNELTGLNAPDINFSKFKNKVIFLNYWATWCPPCVAELPSIQLFYKDYKDKIAFVFVSRENWIDIHSFFIDKGYSFPVYQHKKGLIEGLSEVTSIPRTFIIDRDGNVKVDISGSADWNSKSFRKEIDILLDQ